MLVREASRSGEVKVKLLSVSWDQLARDLERAIDFDQSHLFEMVYSHEFGTPGGEPFGLLVGDYMCPPDMPGDGDASARWIARQVAAAAFCPFITGASPQALGLERFDDLDRVRISPGLRMIRRASAGTACAHRRIPAFSASSCRAS